MKWVQFIILFTVYKSSGLTLKQCLLEKGSDATLITQDDENYQRTNYQVNLRKIIHPKGYVFVKSTRDVEKVIECGKMLNIHYAIQSGGHSFEQYSFGHNYSWILSLKFLNKVEFDEEMGTVCVGSGNNIGSLVHRLWKTCKCSVPVGNCPHVGIGGFTLGGGFGLSSRKHGLLADNVIEMEVVTSDGVTLRANSYQHSDLFWALRGAGGGNFGVVTEFTFKTFNSSHKYIWIKKEYKHTEFHSVMLQWHKWLASNISSSVTSNIIGNAQLLILWILIDNFELQLSELELIKIKSYLPNIKKKDIGKGTFIQYYKSLSITDWPDGTDDTQFYHKAKSFFVSKLLNEQEINYFSNFIMTHGYVTFVFDMYGGAINEVKATDTAFVHRNSYYNVQFAFGVLHQKNLSVFDTISVGKQLHHHFNYILTSLSFMDSGESYQNYVDEDHFDWFQRYYGINCKRLHRVKWTYDRDEFFVFNQSIVPILI